MQKIFEQMEALVIDFYRQYNKYCADNNKPVYPTLSEKKQSFLSQLALDFDTARQGDALPGYTFDSETKHYHIKRIFTGSGAGAGDVISIYNALCKIEGRKRITPTCPEVSQLDTFEITTDSKLNIFSFCAGKDAIRVQLAGVCLDHGRAVATDATALIIAPAKYAAENEGVIFSKTGEKIEGKYVNYTPAMPEYKELLKIDLTANYKAIDRAIINCRCAVDAVDGAGASNKNKLPIAINNNYYFDAQKNGPLYKVLKYAKKYQVFLYVPSETNTKASYFTLHDKKTREYIAGGICMPLHPEVLIKEVVTLEFETVDGLEVRSAILTPQEAAPAAELPAVEADTADSPAAAHEAAQDTQADQLPEPPAVVYVSEPCPPTPQEVPQAAELPAVEPDTADSPAAAHEAAQDTQADQLPEPPAVVYVSEPCPPTPQEAPQAAELPAVEDSTLEDTQTAPQAAELPAVETDTADSPAAAHEAAQDAQADQLPEPPAVVYVSGPVPPTPRRRRRPSGFRPARFRRTVSRAAASLLVFVFAAVLSFTWPPFEGAQAAAMQARAVTLPEVVITAAQDAPAPAVEDGTTADSLAPQDGPAVLKDNAGPDITSPAALADADTADSPAADHDTADTSSDSDTADGLAPATGAGMAAAPVWYTCTACYNTPAAAITPLS